MSHLSKFIQKCNSNLVNNTNSQEIASALDYLHKRGISNNTIKSNNIGYFNTKDVVYDEIAFYGKDQKEINELKRDGKSGHSYFIRGRIIVPIYSEFGDEVGFATRKPSFEQGNTWWNLSKPFKKSLHLFMLDKSRKDIFDNNKIYIVEGYVDALILNQYGIKNVVCIMGTNLSSRQIGLIARYCSNICICLDCDKNNAGQKAQRKLIHALKKFDFYESISVINGLPIGEDPDVFVIKNGMDKLLKLEEKLEEEEIIKIYKEVMVETRKKN